MPPTVSTFARFTALVALQATAYRSASVVIGRHRCAVRLAARLVLAPARHVRHRQEDVADLYTG
ncbi:hypothetical protein ACFWSF_22825 [Streptomyces sp. NPDC058611]|uniref:hypothetical protein n=1 Tax=unclassified Streptomyces TaxID=2593676 RepID=UPI003655CA8B